MDELTWSYADPTALGKTINIVNDSDEIQVTCSLPPNDFNRLYKTLMREQKFTPFRVIFNYPVTVVLWADGTKTVVKCQEGDNYDKITGLALCYMKKALGNVGNYNDIIREFIPEDV